MRTIIRDNYTPKNGDYHEKILIDEAQNKTWMFDCDGVFTPIPTPVNVVDEYGPSTTDAASQRLVTETMNTASEAIQAETEAREAADRLLQEEIEEIEMSSDVVDIVGTHAELEQYDTQHLRDNDIIKVLRDETRQNQTTYYRWSTSAQDFTYVGAEGPYYTESQVDNLLDAKADKATTYTKTEADALLDNKVDKEAGKGLSTNDFTDNDKSKLDGIEAGAQANVQSDWDQTDNTADDYIKNKPTLPTNFVGTDGQTDGAAGLVPAPLSTDAGKYLKADGTWASIVIPQSGIPTTATFWGASYDSVNNNVDGAFTVNSTYSGSPTKLDIGKYTNGSTPHIRSKGSAIALGGSKVSLTSGGTERLSIDGSNIFTWATLYMTKSSSSTSYNQIKSVADPTSAQDAATKNYVDTHNTLSGASAPTTSTVGYVGQFYLDTTNDQMYYLSSIDDTVDPVEYNWEAVGGGSSVNVVQTTGTSATDVMSQAATTNMIYPSGSETSNTNIFIQGGGQGTLDYVCIGPAQTSGYVNTVQGATALGCGAVATGTRSIAIAGGSTARTASGIESIALDGSATANYAIAIGGSSSASSQNGIAIGHSALAGNAQSIAIGYNASASSNPDTIAIGENARAWGVGSVAIGHNILINTGVGGDGCVVIGNGASNNTQYTTRSNEFCVHASTTANQPMVHSNVDTPTLGTDAANKNYVDGKVLSNAGAPTTSTVGTVGQLLVDTTNGKLYICTDATNPYVWTEVGAGAGPVFTLQTTDPGEGEPLAANNFIGVYN